MSGLPFSRTLFPDNLPSM